jgi:hypothetical protein
MSESPSVGGTNLFVPPVRDPHDAERGGGGCVFYIRMIRWRATRVRRTRDAGRATRTVGGAHLHDHLLERICFPVAALLARVDGTSFLVFAEFFPVEFCFVRRSDAETMLRSFFF